MDSRCAYHPARLPFQSLFSKVRDSGRQEKDWALVTEAVMERYGKLDVVGNNAGITGFEGDPIAHNPEHARGSSSRLLRLKRIKRNLLSRKNSQLARTRRQCVSFTGRRRPIYMYSEDAFPIRGAIHSDVFCLEIGRRKVATWRDRAIRLSDPDDECCSRRGPVRAKPQLFRGRVALENQTAVPA